MALGGLLLCGLLLGCSTRERASSRGALYAQGHGFALAAAIAGAGLTGAAVLWAAGRISLVWGADPGDEAQALSASEGENANRPLWHMLAPCCLLLALDVLAPQERIAGIAARAVPSFMRQMGTAAFPHGPDWTAWLSLALALGTAAFALFHDRLPDWLDRSVRTTQSVPTRALEALHSGLIGDYVTWLAAGLALMAAVLALA